MFLLLITCELSCSKSHDYVVEKWLFFEPNGMYLELPTIMIDTLQTEEIIIDEIACSMNELIDFVGISGIDSSDVIHGWRNNYIFHSKECKTFSDTLVGQVCLIYFIDTTNNIPKILLFSREVGLMGVIYHSRSKKVLVEREIHNRSGVTSMQYYSITSLVLNDTVLFPKLPQPPLPPD